MCNVVFFWSQPDDVFRIISSTKAPWNHVMSFNYSADLAKLCSKHDIIIDFLVVQVRFHSIMRNFASIPLNVLRYNIPLISSNSNSFFRIMSLMSLDSTPSGKMTIR